jgi:ATP-dependent Clp protease adaptor protein ClpS
MAVREIIDCMPNVLTELRPSGPETSEGRWMAVIFNNDTNSMEEVIEALISATGCDEEEAYMEAWEAHTYGKAPVHFATFDECQEVCACLAPIGLKTEVAKEWQS